MVQRPGYVRIPGSDTLVTKKRGHSAASVVEQAGPASLARADVSVGNDVVTVGPALLQGRSVPLLLDVTDRLGPLLSPESFVVYVQLYRLALDDGKNACRVSLSELSRRTRLRDRRLNKAVADLVDARAIVLVDRTRDGTLYRVSLPEEIFAAAPATTVTATKAATTATKAAPTKSSTAPSTASTSKPLARRAQALDPLTPGPSPAFGGEGRKPRAHAPRAAPVLEPSKVTKAPSSSGAPRSVGDVCAWFAATYGTSAGRGGSDVASVVMELLEDGWTFARLPALFDRFVRAAPKTTPLRDLARVLKLEAP